MSYLRYNTTAQKRGNAGHRIFSFNLYKLQQTAKVAELVDALDLGSSAARRESSSLSFRTNS